MASGTSRFILRGHVLLVVLVTSLFIAADLAAQQPVGGSQTSPPSNPSAGEPFPSAATPVSGAASSSETKGSEANGGTPANEPAKDIPDQAQVVKLGPGDLIELNVYNVPELSTKARIGNSGDVYLPLIDYVHVAGLTQEEAQSVIEKRLDAGGFVRSPHVTIFVDEATSQGVSVLGEVARPGIYADPPDHKLYDVISEAGGFTNSSSRKIAIIRRNEADPIRISLPRNLADDVSGNVDILPGDTITIPRAPIIYVVGDVGRPSGLLVDNGSLTVLQALALAGGTNHTAKLGASRIIRKGPNGMVEEKVAIKKMLEAKAPDVQLHADDILFIPVSGGKVFASKTFDAAMSAATMVTVYTVHP